MSEFSTQRLDFDFDDHVAWYSFTQQARQNYNLDHINYFEVSVWLHYCRIGYSYWLSSCIHVVYGTGIVIYYRENFLWYLCRQFPINTCNSIGIFQLYDLLLVTISRTPLSWNITRRYPVLLIKLWNNHQYSVYSYLLEWFT